MVVERENEREKKMVEERRGEEGGEMHLGERRKCEGTRKRCKDERKEELYRNVTEKKKNEGKKRRRRRTDELRREERM